MNINTPDFSSILELDLDDTLNPKSPISNSVTSMVNIENLQTTRKRGYSDVESTVPDSCSRTIDASLEDHTRLKKSVASSTKHRTKESPLVNRKELRNLRMQIAMISDADGDRPIHVAVVQENLKLVQKLCAVMLKATISIDLTNYLRQTPLHLSVMLGNIEMIKLLLKCGSSLTLKDRNGNSVIHLAVKTEAKKDVLCLILSHPQVNSILNSMDHEGYTALHYAVLRGNKTAVTCLHLSGVDMNVTDGKSGRTALMHAILERNSDMVKHLLELGTCVDIADYSGRSAFELALQVSHKETLKLMENKFLPEELLKPSATHQLSDEDNESTIYHRTKKFKSL